MTASQRTRRSAAAMWHTARRVGLRPGEGGETVIIALLTEQLAPHGLLADVRDLGLTLISANWNRTLTRTGRWTAP